MIGRLHGTLERVSLGRVIVDVRGVGYDVQVPDGLAGRLEADADGQVTLYIHTSVRDDAIDLYGFAGADERELFDRLTSVNRVGPKTALGILSGMSMRNVVHAARAGDVDAFTDVKGIGKKTAQRLILELQDSLDDMTFEKLAPSDETEELELVNDLRAALKNFGYDTSSIDRVIDTLRDDVDQESELDPLLRRALDMLQ
jgi:Holliday junction DNA helicase RuvA